MTTAPRRLELPLLAERFAISRLAPTAPIPEWATPESIFSITRTGAELSVVCELAQVPAGVQAQRGSRVFRVQGPFALTEIGVLSSLASPRAEAKLGLFTISTFDADYLLVVTETLSAAVNALERAGHKTHRSQMK
jgi:hypothetical protein